MSGPRAKSESRLQAEWKQLLSYENPNAARYRTLASMEMPIGQSKAVFWETTHQCYVDRVNEETLHKPVIDVITGQKSLWALKKLAFGKGAVGMDNTHPEWCNELDPYKILEEDQRWFLMKQQGNLPPGEILSYWGAVRANALDVLSRCRSAGAVVMANGIGYPPAQAKSEAAQATIDEIVRVVPLDSIACGQVAPLLHNILQVAPNHFIPWKDRPESACIILRTSPLGAAIYRSFRAPQKPYGGKGFSGDLQIQLPSGKPVLGLRVREGVFDPVHRQLVGPDVVMTVPDAVLEDLTKGTLTPMAASKLDMVKVETFKPESFHTLMACFDGRG